MLRLRVFIRPAFFSRGYRSSTEHDFEDDFEDTDTYNRDMPPPRKQREVIKQVYKESQTTANRSDEEIQKFKNTHSITIKGKSFKPVLTIDEVEMPSPLKDLFRKRSIEKPTPIQSMCWPLAMSGEDMIGVAQTGSGKTLGYLVPAGAHIKAQPEDGAIGPKGLVLAPTRELVQQICTVSADWLRPSMQIAHCGVYGGANRLAQVNDLRRGTDLCVATPGRLIDLIQTRDMSLGNTSFLVLDEADRMLDMGFEQDIRRILGFMRPDRQTLMFSATWPQDVRQLAREFMVKDVTRVNIGSTELCASKNIKQELRFVESDTEKQNALFDLLDQHKNEKILIFAATKRRVTHLAMTILRSGRRCVESHGDISQVKRERALQLFKGGCNIMVASDVAARGLDVRDIKLVVNFDFPQTVEDYVHRIGRTGRQDATGRSVTFFTEMNKAHAKGLIEVLRQAGQDVPDKLQEYVDLRTPSPSFRQTYTKKPFNFRLDRSSNWRNNSGRSRY